MTANLPLSLPDYGLGAAGLGNLYSAISDADALETLRASERAGLGFIDTAPYYGHGLSEQRIGAYLAQTDHKPFLSTKVGRVLSAPGAEGIPDNGFVAPAPFVPEFDYSAYGIRASFESSQVRLGIASVDVLLLHDVGELVHGEKHGAVQRQAINEAIPAMAALKAEGKTRWIGLGVNEVRVCEEVLEHVKLDVLLIAGRYTLLDHLTAMPFLVDCHRNGVRVILGGAFNSGLLAAAANEPQRYDYVQAPQWAVERTGQLRAVCKMFDTPLGAVALQFCKANPAVESVIPGAQTVAQVRQIDEWSKTKIDPGLWQALKDRALISPDAPVPSC